MNAAIRAVVRTALCGGMSVVGIERGYQGILDKSFREMQMRSVSDIVQRGGTILRTARCMDFHKPECQDEAIEKMRAEGIEGLIVIGGDGSFRGARALSEKGFPTIGIPGTIDNDLSYTDFTIGFHTACNTCLEAIDRIRDTSSSHDRFTIVEVMGRHCGDIALYSGIAGGAELIIIPEVQMTFSDIKKEIVEASQKDKNQRHSHSCRGRVRSGRTYALSSARNESFHSRYRARSSAERRFAFNARPRACNAVRLSCRRSS